ncbi:methyltransferase domain-containing protein [Lutibacter sp.]
MKDYRDLALTSKNIDIYFPLIQKVETISYVAKKYFSGTLLDIGCGKMPYKKMIQEESKIDMYTGVDIKNDIYQRNVKPDFYWDGKKLPFENNKYSSGMLIEVLEHVPNPESVLKEINRVINNKGVLLITVPFLWTLHDVPNDEYRYTPFALRRMLEDTGYRIIEMESFGSWNGSLASVLALYVRRHLTGKKKMYASKLLKPLLKYLYKKDKKADKKKFSEGQMITGIWCVAEVVKQKISD